MTPTEFLQNRNIVAEDKTGLIIGFDNGTKESLIELLESYHQAKVKNLGLFSVSQQRELLLAFAKHIEKAGYDGSCLTYEQELDEFLKANNCG